MDQAGYDQRLYGWDGMDGWMDVMMDGWTDEGMNVLTDGYGYNSLIRASPHQLGADLLP